MDEQTFFSHDGVRVTNARFVVDESTYAIRNITSTAAWTRPRKWLAALICGLIGAGTVANAPLIGGFFFVLAAVLLYIGRPIHYVRLHTAGGEIKAVKSYDLEYVRQVVAALNNALVTQHKGVV